MSLLLIASRIASNGRVFKLSSFLRVAARLSNMVDSINESCPVLPTGVGEMMGSGKQGEVYDMGDRVLKVQIAVDEDDAKDKVSQINHLKDMNSDVYPKVFEADVLCEISPEGSTGRKNGFAYYYIMEKLEPADGTAEISKIINAKLRNRPVKEFMDSPHFDDALELYDRMEASNTTHVDVNEGNIMKCSDGYLKLIDLDSVIIS